MGLFLLIDWTHSNNFSRIFGIIYQLLFLPYFINKIIFYYRAYHDFQFNKDNFSDQFSPGYDALVFVLLLMIGIVFYSGRKIKAKIAVSKID